MADYTDDFCRTGSLPGPGLIEALRMVLENEADGVGVVVLAGWGPTPILSSGQ